MGNKLLEIFLGVLVGLVGVVVLLYAIGYVRNWKLPGLAALKHHFSSSDTTASSSAATTAAAANIALPTTDANGNNYCPNGWTMTYSDGSRYTCNSTGSNNGPATGLCGANDTGESVSASFNKSWNSDSKKQWAINCGHIQWTKPADGIPSGSDTNVIPYSEVCYKTNFRCYGSCSYEPTQNLWHSSAMYVYCNPSNGGKRIGVGWIF